MNNVNMIKFESITTISDETLQTTIGGDHIPNSGGGGALPIGRNILLLQTFRAQMVRHITDLQINTVMLAGIGQETSF